MTRRDLLKCVHEPFGDAYYFGPERLAERYADDEERREASGFSQSTYQIIMERINMDNTEVRACPPSASKDLFDCSLSLHALNPFL